MSTAPPLIALQNWLVARIVAPQAHVKSASDDADKYVCEAGALSAIARVAIYEDGYFARLVECLRDDFPVTADFVDTQLDEAINFTSLARGYIVAYPSRSPNLNRYGGSFSAYLHRIAKDDNPGLTNAQATFCADLAALEWALVEVLHAQCASPLPGDALATVPADKWSHARFVASNAVKLLTTAYPVNTYFQHCKDSEASHSMPAPLTSTTLVYRTELTLWRMPLTPPMCVLLQALLRGESLMDAMTALENAISSEAEGADVAAKIGTWFRAWAEGGVFAHIIIGAPDDATGAQHATCIV
jgi:Putative DNA-binding domain